MTPTAIFPDAQPPDPPFAPGRTSLDALRSLKKYVAAAFPGWEVRLTFEEGAFVRPFCRVGFAGPELSAGAAHTVDVTRPFNLLFHPAEASSPDEALTEAAYVQARVTRLIEQGMQWLEGDPPALQRGGARRVPLWDWTDVPLTATSLKRGENDYLRVTNLSTDIVADPAEELLRAVTADIRMSWRREGSVPFGRRSLVAVQTQIDTP